MAIGSKLNVVGFRLVALGRLSPSAKEGEGFVLIYWAAYSWVL